MRPCLTRRFQTQPEVSAGLPHDSKVDLYSLGVVLFEMLRPFATGMGRAAELSALRATSAPPPDFVASYPAPAALISKLLCPDPLGRPSAAEALAMVPPRVGVRFSIPSVPTPPPLTHRMSYPFPLLASLPL